MRHTGCRHDINGFQEDSGEFGRYCGQYPIDHERTEGDPPHRQQHAPGGIIEHGPSSFGAECGIHPTDADIMVPEQVYQMRPVTLTSASTIMQQVGDNLAGDKIPVSITLVLGSNSYQEKDVMIPVVPAVRYIVNAWWRTVGERNLTEPNFIGLSQEPSECVICDGQGDDCDPIRAGMDILITPVVQLKPMSSEVHVWIAATVKDLDEFNFSLGDQRTIDRNVLDLWRQIHGQWDEYREIVARFPSDAAECKWKDQFRLTDPLGR
jgi:hypothetical protein